MSGRHQYCVGYEPALRVVWKALRTAAESRGLGLARGRAALRVLNSVNLGGALAIGWRLRWHHRFRSWNYVWL